MDPNTREGLDQDWLKLVLEAKKMGLTIEEIRLFLNSNPIHDKNEYPEAL